MNGWDFLQNQRINFTWVLWRLKSFFFFLRQYTLHIYFPNLYGSHSGALAWVLSHISIKTTFLKTKRYILILRVGWFYFHRRQIVTPRTKSLIVKFQALIICKQCKMWTRIEGILDLIHMSRGGHWIFLWLGSFICKYYELTALLLFSVGYCQNTMM